MSVASIAIIRKGVNLTEIKNELEKKYSDVNILKSISEISFFIWLRYSLSSIILIKKTSFLS